jgi:hypothetical protein
MNYCRSIKASLAFALFLLSNSDQSFSSSQSVLLGQPTFFGSGCQNGTMDFVLSPDGSELSVLFDNFIVEAGNGTRVDTKTCSTTIPISIPLGHSLTITQADYRGFNSLPKGAFSQLQTQYQFLGQPVKNEKRAKPFVGPISDEFFDSNQERAKSPCGGRVVLSVDTVLTVTTNEQQDQAFSQVDTVDRNTHQRRKDRKFKYKLSLKRCDSGSLLSPLR